MELHTGSKYPQHPMGHSRCPTAALGSPKTKQREKEDDLVVQHDELNAHLRILLPVTTHMSSKTPTMREASMRKTPTMREAPTVCETATVCETVSTMRKSSTAMCETVSTVKSVPTMKTVSTMKTMPVRPEVKRKTETGAPEVRISVVAVWIVRIVRVRIAVARNVDRAGFIVNHVR